jgi:hypothetical protein
MARMERGLSSKRNIGPHKSVDATLRLETLTSPFSVQVVDLHIAVSKLWANLLLNLQAHV